MVQLNVRVNSARPDFRTFLHLAYGIEANVDTDGDAKPVYTREWTYLYMRLREDGAKPVRAEAVDGDWWAVESDDAALAEVVALYLFEVCGAAIERDGHSVAPETVAAAREAHARALKRAQGSPWHRSCEDDPYCDRWGAAT